MLSFLLIFSFDYEDTAEGLVSGHPEDAKNVSTTECPESGLTATTDAVIQFTNVNTLLNRCGQQHSEANGISFTVFTYGSFK